MNIKILKGMSSYFLSTLPHLQNQQEPPALPHIFRVRSAYYTLRGRIAQCATQPLVLFVYVRRNPFPYSSRRFTTRRRRGLSSRFLTSTFTPASSGSTRIRPQYSHTMIFLRVRMSN